MDGSKEEVVGGLHSHKLQTGGHRGFHVVAHLVDACVHLRRVGLRSLEHHEQNARLAVDVRKETVALSANLHLGHIAQVQQVAAVGGAQHNIIELLDRL